MQRADCVSFCSILSEGLGHLLGVPEPAPPDTKGWLWSSFGKSKLHSDFDGAGGARPSFPAV